MRILIEAHHPAHIHFFKHLVAQVHENGHECVLVGRDRDVMRSLLHAYPWIPVFAETKAASGIRNRFPVSEMTRRHFLVARALRAFQPDLMLSLMGSYSQLAGLAGVPNWIFTDSEFQSFNHCIAHPFATRIYTPNCFYKELGRKQIRYPSYHELAFLHPNRFQPNKEVLSYLGNVRANDYVILRLSAWDTLHDLRNSGLGETARELVKRVRNSFPVFIISEGGKLPPEWEDLRFPAPPHLLHDALAFARLVVTEGASTASEAACLGTPTVYVNSTAPRGYLTDQQRRYGIPLCYRQASGVMEAVNALLSEPSDEEDRRRRRAAIVADHVDLTDYVASEVEAFAQRQGSGCAA